MVTKVIIFFYLNLIFQIDRNTSVLSIQWMLIVCGIYYFVIPNSCTGFGNWICFAPKAFLNLLNFSVFFSPLFPGMEMGGMPPPSAVTKSTRKLSDALWEPHISILSHFIWHFNFYCAARVRRAEKQRKTGAILARQQWAVATCGSDSFRGVMGCMVLHYNS